MQTLAWITRPMPFMAGCHQRYGDVFTVKVAQEGTWVFLAHPDAIKQVFTGDPELYHAGEGNSVLAPIVGSHSVLLLDERPHMAQRKLMLPAFHGERMQRYGDTMAAIASEEIARWPRGATVPLAPGMQALTLEVIMKVVFGVTDAERLNDLRRRMRSMLSLSTDPRAWLAFALLGPSRVNRVGFFRRPMDAVDELIYDELRDRRSDGAAAPREDILSLLLEARHDDGSAMTDVELRDELMTLLVAGHETTATALSWAVERLLRHPDKLARLRAELEAGREDYLDAVIKETLRLRPATTCLPESRVRPASTSSTAGRTCTPTPPPSVRSDSSSSPPAPTPGSRSAAACAAAWERASRCSR
jgi:cytochrome P450